MGNAGGSPTKAEVNARKRASKTNRALLPLHVAGKAAAYKRHLKAVALLERAITQKRELEPWEREYVREFRWTNQDVSFFGKDLEDRYGDPRLSKQEIDLKNEGPMLFKIEGFSWPAPEGSSARAAR